MVVLNRIYTRTGDDGTTALGTGERRKKYDLRIDAYGTVDEANAVIGIARLHTADAPAVDAMLSRIQNDLFDVEADLCLSEKGPGGARLINSGCWTYDSYFVTDTPGESPYWPGAAVLVGGAALLRAGVLSFVCAGRAESRALPPQAASATSSPHSVGVRSARVSRTVTSRRDSSMTRIPPP